MAAPKDPRPCSIADALALVGEKYSLLVLREVCLGNGRFDQLVRNIGAPRDVLAARLRRLVDGGSSPSASTANARSASSTGRRRRAWNWSRC
ncbi:hypothetical protein GCM10020256_66640 [Streptomyces thermocoprophilus]